MSKNILILSGSPRKGGNSDTLCDQFAEGAREAGHQVEKLFISKMNIHYCTGCGTCINGKKPCPQKDDMADILDKMVNADVIVMATPVYFYTMNGQMKTLIDRTCARYTEITRTDFYYIMTAADSNRNNMTRTIEEFRGFLSCLDHVTEKGIIFGTGLWEKSDIKGKSILQETYQMGKAV